MSLNSYFCPKCKDRWVFDDELSCPSCGNLRYEIESPPIPVKPFNYSPPVEKITLDNCDRILLEKQERHLYLEKRRGWIYDNPQLRKEARSGAYRVNTHRLYHHFENWLNDASITYLRNMQTGEKVRHLAPKRGNKAYAAKYRKKLNEIATALSGCVLNEPFGNTGRYQRTKALLITFTYGHKTTDIQESWANVSSDIAKWKIQAKRKLGADSIATLAIKEGTESGYPAPHMLLLLDRPVIVVRHVSKKNGAITWRVQSFPILDALKSAWHKGFIDVQGVIDKQVSNGKDKVSVIRYLFKYLTKAVNLEQSDESVSSEIAEKYKNIGIKTFAWQKIFMLRPLHLSKAFKVFVRLDTAIDESQHGIWRFDHADHCRLSESGYILNSSMPPDPVPWPTVSKFTKTMTEQLADMHEFTKNGGILTLECEEYYLKFGKYPLITKH